MQTYELAAPADGVAADAARMKSQCRALEAASARLPLVLLRMLESRTRRLDTEAVHTRASISEGTARTST